MTDNYKVYLGSDSGRDYQESVKHVMGRANYLLSNYQHYIDDIKQVLEIIHTSDGNPLYCMESLGTTKQRPPLTYYYTLILMLLNKMLM